MADESQTEADMADCVTFFHTVDRRKFKDVDVLLTPVFTFDPPTDYGVRGRVTWDDEQWKIFITLLPMRNLEEPVIPVRFTWTVSVVKGRKSLLKGAQDVKWEKIYKELDSANDYDVMDPIEIQHSDQMDNADGPITFKWFVKLFLHDLLPFDTTDKEKGQPRPSRVKKSDVSKQGRKVSLKTPFVDKAAGMVQDKYNKRLCYVAGIILAIVVVMLSACYVFPYSKESNVALSLIVTAAVFIFWYIKSQDNEMAGFLKRQDAVEYNLGGKNTLTRLAQLKCD